MNKFFKMPKAIFTNEKYAGLGETTKIVYMMILDRFCLSLANGWKDRKGNTYCIYTVEELIQDTNTSRGTINRAKRELKECGLVYEYRTGKANHIYVYQPEEPENTEEPTTNIIDDTEVQNLGTNDTELPRLKDQESNKRSENGRAKSNNHANSQTQESSSSEKELVDVDKKESDPVIDLIYYTGWFDMNFCKGVVQSFGKDVTPQMVANQIIKMKNMSCSYPKAYFMNGIQMQVDAEKQGISLSNKPQPKHNDPSQNHKPIALGKIPMHDWTEV